MSTHKKVEASQYALNKILERPILSLSSGYYCCHIFSREDREVSCKVLVGSNTTSPKASDYLNSLPMHFFTFSFNLDELEDNKSIQFDLRVPNGSLPPKILEKRYRDILESAYAKGAAKLYGITISDPELEGVSY